MSTMTAHEQRRFAMAHLTFERNAEMGREGNNGIKDAEALIAPLGWRWISARLVPRREIDKAHAEYAESVEGFVEMAQSLLDDALYMGELPSEDEMWELKEAFEDVQRHSGFDLR